MEENYVRQYDWEYCPSEVLVLIFKKLDAETLLTCMQVNVKWRDVADYVAKTLGLWQKIVEQTIVDGGVTYRRKSKLQWDEIHKNSLLWCNLDKAKLTIKRYEEEIVRNIYVYKDNLIIVCDFNVKYYDIETMKLIKVISIKCDSFEESDHMVVTMTTKINSNNSNLLVTMYGKPQSDISTLMETHSESKEVKIYRLEDDRCCFIDAKNCVFFMIWDRVQCKFIHKCLGRAYSSGVLALYMCREEMYIILKSGAVFQCDTRKMAALEKRFTLSIPSHAIGMPLFMFHKFSAVVKVRPENDFKINHHESSGGVVLECPGLSCATEHGNVLFLGYCDGKVEIVKPDKLASNGGTPELRLHVQQLDPSIDKPQVHCLNVYEVRDAHHLLIGTQHRVLQVVITY